jgi:hypothetical protein
MNDITKSHHKAVDFIRDNAERYAQAKADRVYTEEFRKSKKALLMKDAMLNGIEAVNAQEREAYSNPEYVELLKGIAEAILIEETLKWQMMAASMRVDVWRTEQANARMEGRATE